MDLLTVELGNTPDSPSCTDTLTYSLIHSVTSRSTARQFIVLKLYAITARTINQNGLEPIGSSA